MIHTVEPAACQLQFTNDRQAREQIQIDWDSGRDDDQIHIAERSSDLRLDSDAREVFDDLRRQAMAKARLMGYSTAPTGTGMSDAERKAIKERRKREKQNKKKNRKK